MATIDRRWLGRPTEAPELVREKPAPGMVANWHRPGIPDTKCGRHIAVVSTLRASAVDIRAGFVPDLCGECFDEQAR